MAYTRTMPFSGMSELPFVGEGKRKKGEDLKVEPRISQKAAVFSFSNIDSIYFFTLIGTFPNCTMRIDPLLPKFFFLSSPYSHILLFNFISTFQQTRENKHLQHQLFCEFYTIMGDLDLRSSFHPTQIKAVIFDLDGTLLNTGPNSSTFLCHFFCFIKIDMLGLL